MKGTKKLPQKSSGGPTAIFQYLMFQSKGGKCVMQKLNLLIIFCNAPSGYQSSPLQHIKINKKSREPLSFPLRVIENSVRFQLFSSLHIILDYPRGSKRLRLLPWKVPDAKTGCCWDSIYEFNAQTRPPVHQRIQSVTALCVEFLLVKSLNFRLTND